jgi:amino acid adenylation domain-containing protein
VWKGSRESGAAVTDIAPAAADDIGRSRLTATQAGVYAAHSLRPDVPLWSVPIAVRIHGPIDRPAFARAFRSLVQSADCLRMVVSEVDGTAWQQVGASADELPEAVDLSRDDTGACERWLQARAARVPDLSVRHVDSALLRLADEDHVWFLNQHHLFTDGWSNGLLLQRMSRLYLCEIGSGEPLPPPFPPLLDRLRDVRRYEQSDAAAADRRYFTDLLSDEIEPYKFFGVTPRRTGTASVRLAHRLDRDRTRQLRAIAAAVGDVRHEGYATRFYLAASLLLALLHRVTGRRANAIGAPYHNRHAGDDKRASALLRQTPGLFADVLPLVVEVDPVDSFATLVEKVRGAWAGVIEHARGGITPEVRRRACDVVLNYGNVPLPQLFGARTTVDWLPTGRGLESLAIRVDDPDSSGEIDLRFDFQAEAFPGEMRPRIVERFLRVIDACLEDPSRPISAIPLLPPRERIKVLEEWNRTAVPGTTEVPVPDLIEAQAGRTPDAVAVESEDDQLTYRALDGLAGAVAGALRAHGVGPETLVALCIERSIPQIVALLGIHKTGAAFLPLDPKLPAERMRYLLSNARSAHLVTTRALRRSLPAEPRDVIVIEDVLERWNGELPDAPDRPRETRAAAGNLAYVIYTSGSTGAPKGVEVEHGSLANLVQFSIPFFDLAPGDRWLQFNSLSFDFSLEEIFPTLVAGATLVLRNDAMIDSADAFLDACERHRITVLALPTAYWHTIVDIAGGRREFPPTVRLLILGGEAVRPDLLARWHQWAGTSIRLVNGYGPTETTVAMTFADLTRRAREEAERGLVAIGPPCWNAEAYVLDAAGQPTGPGFAGELYIGGLVVGRGYRGDPALTASRFVPHPAKSGERVYRTGDSVRWREGGELEYLGRLDQQVKVRGYRVEPGEVETHLHACPSVREAIVVPQAIGTETRLVAYIGTGQHVPILSDVRAFLEARLPAYMVPSVLVRMDRLPRSTSGKVDRSALPPADVPVSEAAEEPMSAAEAAIAVIFREELRVDRVGPRDSFFDLGGESLLGMRVVARMTRALGRTVPLSLLFDHPTVAGLAVAVDSLPPAPVPRVVVRGPRSTMDDHAAPERTPSGDLQQ